MHLWLFINHVYMFRPPSQSSLPTEYLRNQHNSGFYDLKTELSIIISWFILRDLGFYNILWTYILYLFATQSILLYSLILYTLTMVTERGPNT